MTETQQIIIKTLKNDRFVSASVLSTLTNLPLPEICEELSSLEYTNAIRFLPFKDHKGSVDKAYYLRSN
jgi:hypothetical protein